VKRLACSPSRNPNPELLDPRGTDPVTDLVLRWSSDLPRL
jgi:hypothetical protein